MYADIIAGYQVHVLGKDSTTGLDTFRNSLVHKGQSVVKSRPFITITNTFDAITNLVKLDKDSYKNLNTIIRKKMFL